MNYLCWKERIKVLTRVLDKHDVLLVKPAFIYGRPESTKDLNALTIEVHILIVKSRSRTQHEFVLQ